MARRRPAQVHGLLVIDKPAGMTSHDVVDRLRKVLGERKVGHSGTLDPDATGVLLVGVGDSTRLLRFLDNVVIDQVSTTSKSYTATIVLGAETNTLDASGEVTELHDMEQEISELSVTSVQILVDEHFVGNIFQVPPMVSALKVDGRRLHELAREGIEVERKARPVTVHEFTVLAVHENFIDVDIRCTSGTYIRTLAADLGKLLGGGAHLKDLRRTSIGRFTLTDAVALNDLSPQNYSRHLLAVVECVRGLSRVDTAPGTVLDIYADVLVGKVLPAHIFDGRPPWAVVGEGERLLAVYEPFSNHKVGENMARPAIVIAR